MLSITAFKSVSSSAGVRKYLEEGHIMGQEPQNALSNKEDYFLEGGKAQAYFTGGLLDRLGECREYSPEVFERLFMGLDKAGNALTQSKLETRRPGWDLTFSAPKSVSVAWGIANEAEQKIIQKAHDRAVKEALSYIEKHVPITSTGRGERQRDGQMKVDMTSGKFAAAVFQHGTSREQDPALHTHALVFNLAEREDGSVMSLNSREIYHYKKLIGTLYRVSLAQHLKEQGFSVERDGFSFKVSGIDRSVEKHFSKRSEQIAQALLRSGQSSEKAADIAALATREGKQDQPVTELKQRWREQANGYGLSPESIQDLRKSYVVTHESDESTQDRQEDDKKYPSFSELFEELTRHQSVFDRRQAMEVIATQSQGRLSLSETLEHIDRFFSQRNKQLVQLQDKGKTLYTSKEMLALEKAIVQTADRLHERRELHPVKNKKADKLLSGFKDKHGFELTKEQTDFVKHLTEHTGAIALSQGNAGTGKTVALYAAAEIWRSSGYRVRAASLSGKAASGMTLIDPNASTIHSLLLKASDHQDDYGHIDKATDPIRSSDVIVIDEAGTVDSRLMHRLTQLVETAGAKLVLVGDVKQNQPVAAGGPFAAIQKHTALPVVQLEQAQRQKTEITRRVVDNVLNLKPLAALSELSLAGHFQAFESAQESFAQTVDAWQRHFDPLSFDSSVIITNTNMEKSRLNELARERLNQSDLLDTDRSVSIEVQNTQGQTLGKKPFTEGDRIIFRKNDKTLGVKNGELANIVAIRMAKSGFEIITEKEDGSEVTFNTHNYNRFDHGYAITTYASQGMTVDHAAVYIGEGVQNFHASYVQFSRVRKGVDVSVHQKSMDAYLSSIAPTERMIEAAKNVLGDDAKNHTLAQWSFLQVQQLLNQHHVPADQEDFKRQFEELGRAMTRQEIKKTTLEFQRVEKAISNNTLGHTEQTQSTATPPQPSLQNSSDRQNKPTEPKNPYYDLDRIKHNLMERADTYIASLIDESKNSKLSNARMSVWGQHGSVRLNTDPNHPYFGKISDFERGYSGDLIGYIASLSNQSWYDTLKKVADELKVPANENSVSNLKDQAKREQVKVQKEFNAKLQEAKDQQERIERAQKIWARSQPLAGTLGEQYLKKVRGIQRDLNSDSVRFLPKAWDVVRDEIGQISQKVHRPAIVFAAKDAQGTITAVQQIYLDPVTGEKNNDAKVVKKSIGVVKGSAVQIHQGHSNKVFIAEGPETGASVAVAHPDANVYVTLGNTRNFAQLGHLADKHGTKELLFLADNDGGRQADSYEGLEKSAQELADKGLTVRITMPYMMAGQHKTDFNDVLRAKGAQEIRHQMQLADRVQSTEERQMSRGR